MSKNFRAWKIDEPLFLAPMVQDFVAKDHLARFVLSLVRDDIDLAEIIGRYGSERGQPPFDPVMMTALLLYSYCRGVYSSRRIGGACRERVDFMSIVALDERIRKAKAELEAEAKASAEAKLKAAAAAQQQREAEGRKKPGRQAAPPSTAPDPKAQKNFTDPEKPDHEEQERLRAG